jgi:hypothetical protein
MTFFNQGPNQVRQLGHISTDGGKTWTVTFDLTYVRKNRRTELLYRSIDPLTIDLLTIPEPQ